MLFGAGNPCINQRGFEGIKLNQKKRPKMKTTLFLVILTAISVMGQGYIETPEQRTARYKARGLSFNDPVPDRKRYSISHIPEDSPQMKAIFQEFAKTRPGITQEQFVANVKAGKAYEVTKSGPLETCKKCNGFGKLAYDAKSREPDKKPKCGSCKGTGKVSVKSYLTIVWHPAKP